MSLSVYIISEIKDPNDVPMTLRQRMFSIQVDLVSKGFVVFNPIDILDQYRSKKISNYLFFKRKFELLHQANAVYVMSNIDLQKNIELQIANRLNLIIIQPTVFLSY